MSSDRELELLAELVNQDGGDLTGSALLDEADRRLGREVSGNALMWFALRRNPGNFGLARALLRARYLAPDEAMVDSLMEEILASPGDGGAP